MNGLLFCYGTLRHDVPDTRFSLLGEGTRIVSPASVQGRLFDLDGYPGLRLDPDTGERITGWLYRLADPAASLRRLDDYEGCAPASPEPHEYRRIETNITTEHGCVRAWIYVCTETCQPLTTITGGDYRAWLKDRC